MNDDKVEQWLDEIKLSQVKNEELQQALANPLEYSELDLQQRSLPDNVFSALPVFNEVNSLTTISDNQLEFEILRPDPILLNSIYFQIQLTVTTQINTPGDKYKVIPVADFMAQLFNCTQILVGQNSCNIDHLDTNSDMFHYIIRRLYTDEQYSNYLGYLEYLMPDTPGQYESTDPTKNTGFKTRYDALFEKMDTNGFACVRGVYIPPNLFFQQKKILPPYVPLRIILRKNPVCALLKTASGSALTPSIEFKSVKLNFTQVKLRNGIYEEFRNQYVANKTRFPPLEVPTNPYTNPQAIYQYLDVRAQKIPIPKGTDFVQTLRSNSAMPKGIIFALAKYRKTNCNQNHMFLPLDDLKSYSILVNSQPIKSCSVDQIDCSAQFQDMWLRQTNFLGNFLTNDTNGLSYQDFQGGAGIICELTNFANNLYIPARQDVANIELKLTFKSAVEGYEVYIFLIYDQILIIDKEFNARTITSV